MTQEQVKVAMAVLNYKYCRNKDEYVKAFDIVPPYFLPRVPPLMFPIYAKVVYYDGTTDAVMDYKTPEKAHVLCDVLLHAMTSN